MKNSKVVIISAAFLMACLIGLLPSNASAAPSFQMPFPCNQKWEGQTRTNHSPQNSVDLNRTNDEGDTVVASASGTIETVKDLGNTSYGKYIVINHGGGWKTYYAHLSKFSVSQGKSINPGQKIGEVGNTGGSSGAHLHYEQRYNGTPQKIKWNGSQIYYWGIKTYTSKNNCGGESKPTPKPKPTPAPSADAIGVMNNRGDTDTVTITGLKSGDIAKVYNSAKGDDLLGKGTTSDQGKTSIPITLDSDGGTIYVSVTSGKNSESSRTAKSYEEEPKPTPAPSADTIRVTNNREDKDTVTVTGLKPGDVVKAYNAAKGNNLLSKGTASDKGTISVPVSLDPAGGAVYITVTSGKNLESSRTAKPYEGENDILRVTPVNGYIEGTMTDVVITYNPKDILALGSVVFHLPDGFSATTNDKLNGIPLKSGQISDNGKTVTMPLSIDLLDLAEFKLELSSKKLPTEEIYTFNAENKPLVGIGSKFSGTAKLAVIKAQMEKSITK
ncbi:BslA/BslB family hydrophobin [Priestia aryabhattai]|uniref:BslA/BslB family hydrophobin n=1 Tax=Priestia aryabhattai TaxID=412384 RepID=UPI0039A3ED54